MIRILTALLTTVAVAAPASGAAPADPPAASGAFAPALAATADGAALTWLEAVEAPGGPARHRVRFARLAGGAWSAPRTLVESDRLFANWADTPGVAVAGDGALVAWWLERNGASTYAYGVRLTRSTDGGDSWSDLGWLHDDDSPTEHGFVSMTHEGDALRAFWLDGRATADGRPMTLRTASVGAAVAASELVDDAVCDCCSTAAAAVPGAALVAYRDRSPEEIRDIRVARVRPGAAPSSTPAAEDGWRIEGCPVNGPALVADGERLTVAWFSAPEDRSRVAAAISDDGGATFAAPQVVDAAQPIGRVALAPLPGGDAALAWHARVGDHAEVRLARLTPAGAGAARVLGETSGGRRSGFARLAALPGGDLLAVWTELADGASRLRALRLTPAELARP